MGNEVQKNNESTIPKEKLKEPLGAPEQWKEFEEKYGTQLKGLIEKFKEKMSHSDGEVRNKAKTGYEKLIKSLLKMDEAAKKAFLENANKFNGEEMENLINELSYQKNQKLDNPLQEFDDNKTLSILEEKINQLESKEQKEEFSWKYLGTAKSIAKSFKEKMEHPDPAVRESAKKAYKRLISYIYEVNLKNKEDFLKEVSNINGSKMFSLQDEVFEKISIYNRLKSMDVLIDDLSKYFIHPDISKKFKAITAREWLEKNKDFQERNRLDVNGMKYLAQLIAEGSLKTPLTDQEFEKIPIDFSKNFTGEEVKFPSKLFGRLIEITDEKIPVHELKFYQLILENEDYNKIRGQLNDKVLWKFINYTSPHYDDSIAHQRNNESMVEQVMSFLKDPSFDWILKAYANYPKLNLEMIINIGRTSYLKGQPYSIQLLQEAFEEINFCRKKYGTIKIFEDSILFAHNTYQVSKPEDEKFANPQMIHNLKKATNNKFSYHIAPTGNKNDMEGYEKKVQNFKEEVRNEIINAEHGKTFVFNGHGDPENFYFSLKQNLPAEEFAEILKKRYQKYPPNKDERPDIFIFLSCHSSEYLRKVNDVLGQTATHAIFVLMAEYGYVGLSTPDYKENYFIGEDLPNFLNTGDISNLTIQDIIEAEEKAHNQKKYFTNNPAIYLRLGTRVMQIGKNEDMSEKPPREQAA